MTDTRFTTVAQDMDEFISTLDIDDVADLETLLIVLFGRSITVEETVDDESSFEVIMWNDTMGIGSTYAFPMSMVDLALGCAQTLSDLRSTEDEDEDGSDVGEDSDEPDLEVMDEGDLITTLQRALGQVRLFNMLHADDESGEGGETQVRSTAMVDPGSTNAPEIEPATPALSREEPWVADLQSSFAAGDCQSTVGFDDRRCAGTAQWYVELEVWGQPVANPRWEGKLCNPCLTGWLEWAAEEPDAVKVVSVNPIVAD